MPLINLDFLKDSKSIGGAEARIYNLDRFLDKFISELKSLQRDFNPKQ